MRRGRCVAVAVLGSAALALSGCGSSGGSSGAAPSASATSTPTQTPNAFAGESAQQILDDALAAAKSASSVRVKGKMTDAGKTIEINLAVGKDSADGTVSIDGGTMSLRRIGNDIYIEADKEFWTAQASAAVAALLDGKWLKAPTSNKDFGEFSNFTSVKALLGGMLTPSGTVTRAPGKDVDGTPTVGLHDADSSGGTSGTMYVSATGKPYPLLIVADKEAGSVSFSDWDAAVTVTPPPAADVVDLSSLTGSG